MEPFIAILVVLLGLLAVTAVAMTPVWICVFQSRRGAKVMEAVANRYQGHLFGKPSCCGIPQVAFKQHGQVFNLRVVATKNNRSKQMTYLHGPWPDLYTRINLYPESFWTRAQKMMGMQDIEIGFPNFDNTFILQSDRPESLMYSLSPEVQQILLGMKREFEELGLTVNGGEICLATSTKLNAELMLIHVGNFLALRAKMLQSVTAVVNSIAEKEVAVEKITEAKATCMVCGEGIVDLRVKCKRCNTPHHKDCWGYFGGCSRYGCGETVFVDQK